MLRFFIVFVMLPCILWGQVQEDFSNNDLSNWGGQVDRFMIENETLRLNAPVETGTSSLFISSKTIENATWELGVEMLFNPSSNNLSRIYLVADTNVVDQITQAIYIELGSGNDDVCLYWMEAGEVEKIIDGADDRLDLSSVSIKLMVSHEHGNWIVESDLGNGWERVGTAHKEISFSCHYFGLCCQYTSTRSTKFLFDDIRVSGEAFVDRVPPEISNFRIVNSYTFQLMTNEKLDDASIVDKAFYLKQQNRFPTSVSFEDDTIFLHFYPPIADVENEVMSISGLEDVVGNEIKDTCIHFSYERIGLEQAVLKSDSVLKVEFSKKIGLSMLEGMELSLNSTSINYALEAVEELDSIFYLKLESKVQSDNPYTLILENLVDERGDTLKMHPHILFYYQAHRFDVVFSELMVDPDPSIGMPDGEYIELFNQSANELNLEGWILEVNGKSCELPNVIIPAESYKVLIGEKDLFEDADTFVFVDGWKSLSNTCFQVVLKNTAGQVIDAFRYDRDEISGNDFKKDGGWSVERMDKSNQSGSYENWKWTENLSGGTPGVENSVLAGVLDEESPQVKYFTYDEVGLKVYFSEAMDLIDEELNFEITPAGSVFYVSEVDTVFQSYLCLAPQQKLPENDVFSINIFGLKDLVGRELKLERGIRFGTSDSVISGDVLINEVLFNPTAEGVDFVELFNKSEKIINVSDLAFGEWKEGEIEKLYHLTNENRLMLPGDYLVLSKDSLLILEEYNCKQAQFLLNVSSLPTWSDDEGTVLLTDRRGLILDRFDYSEKLHNDIIADEEGVSLERLSINHPTQDESNWESAASTVGYATPTYENSQKYEVSTAAENGFSVEPKIFIPNNDGNDDLLFIHYNNQEPGGVATIRIFSGVGQQVNCLANNQLMENHGFFTWDGRNDSGEALMPGSYVVFMSCFYPSGKIEEYKKVCVLGIGD